MEFLLPPKNNRTPLFYGLPKIYKPNCPLRPIVLGCDGPTDISLPTSPILSNLLLAIFHHTFKTQNFFSTLLKNFHPFYPCPLGHSQRHALIHKHPTRRQHSSRDSLHGKIQAPTTHKLSISQYTARNTRFHPQT